MSESLEGRSYLPPEEPDTRVSTLALAAFSMGILSWSLLPFVCGILAVVIGHMARIEIARSAGKIAGDDLAVIALVMGYANIGFIALVGLCIGGAFFLSALGNLLGR